MIQFDWTINLGAVVSSALFIFGFGVYVGKLNSFISRATEFFEESRTDRKDLREVSDRRHEENIRKFEHLGQAIVKRPHPGR